MRGPAVPQRATRGPFSAWRRLISPLSNGARIIERWDMLIVESADEGFVDDPARAYVERDLDWVAAATTSACVLCRCCRRVLELRR